MDNISEHTLMARRLIKDHLNEFGGVLNVKLSKELLASVNNASKRYEAYLDERRLEKGKKQ